VAFCSEFGVVLMLYRSDFWKPYKTILLNISLADQVWFIF